MLSGGSSPLVDGHNAAGGSGSPCNTHSSEESDPGARELGCLCTISYQWSGEGCSQGCLVSRPYPLLCGRTGKMAQAKRSRY